MVDNSTIEQQNATQNSLDDYDIAGPNELITRQSNYPVGTLDMLKDTVENSFERNPTPLLLHGIQNLVDHSPGHEQVRQDREAKLRTNDYLIGQAQHSFANSALAFGANMATGLIDPVTLAGGKLAWAGLKELGGVAKLAAPLLSPYVPDIMSGVFKGLGSSGLGVVAKQAIHGGLLGGAYSVPQAVASYTLGPQQGDNYTPNQAWDMVRDNMAFGAIGGVAGGAVMRAWRFFNPLKKAVATGEVGAAGDNVALKSERNQANEENSTPEAKANLQSSLDEVNTKIEKAQDQLNSHVNIANDLAESLDKGESEASPLDAITQAEEQAQAEVNGDHEPYQKYLLRQKIPSGYQAKLVRILKKAPIERTEKELDLLDNIYDPEHEKSIINDEINKLPGTELGEKKYNTLQNRLAEIERFQSNNGLMEVNLNAGELSEDFPRRTYSGDHSMWHDAIDNVNKSGEDLDDLRSQRGILQAQIDSPNVPGPSPLENLQSNASTVDNHVTGKGKQGAEAKDIENQVKEDATNVEQNFEEANKEQFDNLPDEAKKIYDELNSQITGMEGHEHDIVEDLVACIAKTRQRNFHVEQK